MTKNRTHVRRPLHRDTTSPPPLPLQPPPRPPSPIPAPSKPLPQLSNSTSSSNLFGTGTINTSQSINSLNSSGNITSYQVTPTAGVGVGSSQQQQGSSAHAAALAAAQVGDDEILCKMCDAPAIVRCIECKKEYCGADENNCDHDVHLPMRMQGHIRVAIGTSTTDAGTPLAKGSVASRAAALQNLGFGGSRTPSEQQSKCVVLCSVFTRD
jgi:hypothetical protein